MKKQLQYNIHDIHIYVCMYILYLYIYIYTFEAHYALSILELGFGNPQKMAFWC